MLLIAVRRSMSTTLPTSWASYFMRQTSYFVSSHRAHRGRSVTFIVVAFNMGLLRFPFSIFHFPFYIAYNS
jgi:hypothetical protein